MPKTPRGLAAREQQLFDTVQAAGEATVHEVLQGISDPPSYSAVRAMLGILVDKGFLSYRRRGRQYVYRVTINSKHREKSGLRRLVDIAFSGRADKACLALLDLSKDDLTDDDLERLEAMIRKAKQERAS